MNTRHIHQLVLNRRDTSWGPGRWAANGALAEAVDDVAEELLPAAEYGARRKAKQRGYARKHQEKRKQGAALAKAQEAVLGAVLKASNARNWSGGNHVLLTFSSLAETAAFHDAWESFIAARRAAALSDLAQADAELLDAAE